MDIGPYGNIAPVDIYGVPYETVVGALARLETRRGRQLMRPDYGSAYQQYIYHDNLHGLYNAIDQALHGLKDAASLSIQVDGNTRKIQVLANAVLVGNRTGFSREPFFQVTPTEG